MRPTPLANMLLADVMHLRVIPPSATQYCNQVIVLGEAAKAALAADPTLETSLPEVEWSPIARMRDRVTHHYWATDREVVWATATVAVPELLRALTAALSRLRQSES